MLKNMAEGKVKEALQTVLSNIKAASLKKSPDLQFNEPSLVAVTKTKSVDLILEAYNAGQRHFGENYVQEFEEKAHHPVILEKCKEIKWHFIGHLQSNKINKVLAIPNLYIIETLHSIKLADNINKNWLKFAKDGGKLKVYVQVNSSAEEEKNGIEPNEVVDVVQHVIKDCPNLDFQGLMTIGKYGYNPEDGPNPDFTILSKCREELCSKLNMERKNVGLSMGMSTDYELAILQGSTNVRVGQTIFGARGQ